MSIRIPKKGNDVNMLKLVVDRFKADHHAEIRRGVIDSGIIITINNYNVEDVLIQMLEDYGEEFIINKIKSIE